jgi:hypothetical protein
MEYFCSYTRRYGQVLCHAATFTEEDKHRDFILEVGGADNVFTDVSFCCGSDVARAKWTKGSVQSRGVEREREREQDRFNLYDSRGRQTLQ